MAEKTMGFTARTTQEGLDTLNNLRKERKLTWNEMVITAVNSHYNINVPIPAPVEDPAKAQAKAEKAAAAEKTKAEKAEKKAAAEKDAKADQDTPTES